MQIDRSDTADLASVICSRICHDLVSPVGAIVNGVDLIREIGAGGLDSEFSMISQSADRASGLLQFYRIAFGAIGTDAEALARSTLQDRAEGMIASQRVMMHWHGMDGPPMARIEARLLCQLLLCARSVTGMRGTVTVELPHSSSFPMTVIVEGDGAADTVDRLAILKGEVDPGALEPRLVEFALARASVNEMGINLIVDHQPGRVVMQVLRP